MPQYIGSSALLGAGATYTSRWALNDWFAYVSGSVFSDQPGTIYIEQSGDQINADISANYAVTASTGKGFVEQILLPYVRLRFTNTGGSAQTVFRLFSHYQLGNMP